MSRRITADMAGCWVDGARGWGAHVRMLEIALAHGWRPDIYGSFPKKHSKKPLAYARAVIRAYSGRGWNDAPTVRDPWGDIISLDDAHAAIVDQGGLLDEAEEHLNERAPKDHAFGWFDGDFMLWSAQSWEEMTV